MKERKQRTLGIFALALALVATTVAYAALSTTLTISGSVTKKGGTWGIEFQNVTKGSTTGSGQITSLSADSSNQNISFGLQLEKPGDSASFSFNIKNTGSVDAKLRCAAVYQDGSFVASYGGTLWTFDYVDCTLTLNGRSSTFDDAWSINSLNLNHGSTMTGSVSCKYSDSATNVSSDTKSTQVKLQFAFEQK